MLWSSRSTTFSVTQEWYVRVAPMVNGSPSMYLRDEVELENQVASWKLESFSQRISLKSLAEVETGDLIGTVTFIVLKIETSISQ